VDDPVPGSEPGQSYYDRPSSSGVGDGLTKNARRYDEFRDASGSWSFETREYRSDLDSISHVDVSPDPSPGEAYRAAVFPEGYVRERKASSNWTDDALDRFETFGSTREVEAVAKALREVGGRGEQ
jgi:hypothetical protein